MQNKTIFQQTAMWAALLTLTACAAPHVAQPQLTVAATGKVMSAEETAARYQVNPEWWKVYQDARLNALVEQALAHNVDLKQTAINVNKALYQANILGANLVPSFSGSLGANTSKNLSSGSRSTSFSSQLGLSYELDLWRKLSSKADAQTWEYEATQQDLAAAKLSLINNVVSTYFNIAYINEAIALNEQSIKQYREIHRIMNSKYRHGKSSLADPMSSEQSLLSAQNNVLSLQNSREQLIITLRNLLNIQPHDAISSHPEAFRLSRVAKVDLNVPISVLANRPDLLAAEYRLQSAAQSVVAQKRSWYPSITLGASLSSSSSKARTMFDVPLLGGSVSISLPFLDWQTLKWEDKTAEANFESAKLSFEQALTTALNEVSNYYQQYRRVEQTLSNQQQRYALAKKNSRYYQVRYQQGKDELKEWLEALNSEYSQAQTVLNNRYDVLKNENLVYQAMAGRYQVK